MAGSTSLAIIGITSFYRTVESGRCPMVSGDRQISTRAMVANTHNPTPATAHDTPKYPRATINPRQANTRIAFIGCSSEETPHQRQAWSRFHGLSIGIGTLQ